MLPSGHVRLCWGVPPPWICSRLLLTEINQVIINLELKLPWSGGKYQMNLVTGSIQCVKTKHPDSANAEVIYSALSPNDMSQLLPWDEKRGFKAGICCSLDLLSSAQLPSVEQHVGSVAATSSLVFAVQTRATPNLWRLLSFSQRSLIKEPVISVVS